MIRLFHVLLSVAFLPACGGPGAGGNVGPASGSSAAGPAFRPDARCDLGCTFVIGFAPGATSPVVVGPFAVTSINPGGSLDLAMSGHPDCRDLGSGWFEYSGGGLRVGEGQTLCARSTAHASLRHGFSGYRPTAARGPLASGGLSRGHP